MRGLSARGKVIPNSACRNRLPSVGTAPHRQNRVTQLKVALSDTVALSWWRGQYCAKRRPPSVDLTMCLLYELVRLEASKNFLEETWKFSSALASLASQLLWVKLFLRTAENSRPSLLAVVKRTRPWAIDRLSHHENEATALPSLIWSACRI
jgi:hypothetical protein